MDVLTTDPTGEVTARVTIDESELERDHIENALVLGDTLLIPYTDEETRARPVYSAPLAAGDLGGERLEIDLPTGPDVRQEHRLIAVPGAVVSYGTDDSAEIHGLAP